MKTYPEMNEKIAGILRLGAEPEQYAAQYIEELRAENAALQRQLNESRKSRIELAGNRKFEGKTKMSAETFMKMITKTEEEINDMFNSGMFNSLATGYGKMALQAMGMKKEEIRRFEETMNVMFSDYDAIAARKVYKE